MEEVRNYKKLYSSKTHLKMLVGDAMPHIPTLDFALLTLFANH